MRVSTATTSSLVSCSMAVITLRRLRCSPASRVDMYLEVDEHTQGVKTGLTSRIATKKGILKTAVSYRIAADHLFTNEEKMVTFGSRNSRRIIIKTVAKGLSGEVFKRSEGWGVVRHGE